MDDSVTDPAPATPFEPEDAPISPPQLVCPNCGTPVDPSAASAPIIECAKCGTQFFPPAVEDDSDDSDDDSDEEDPTEAELSELRIRQLITLQRTAYRTRSYLIVGTLGCLGFAIQLTIFAVHSLRDNHRLKSSSIACLFFAMAGIIGSYKFAMRVREVQRGINADARARALEEEEVARHPPDLSTLSDGSHHARNLERMFAKEPPSQEDAAAESPANSAGE